MLLLKLALLLLFHSNFSLGNGNRQCCYAFAPPSPSQSTTTVVASHLRYQQSRQLFPPPPQRGATIIISTTSTKSTTTCTTRLYNGIIIDVPDNFFTSAFFTIGLTYSLGKAYNRYLLEEIAFERRKMEAREEKLAQQQQQQRESLLNNDGQVVVDDEIMLTTELETRRMESATWLSIYGRKFRGRGETTTVAADDDDDDSGAEDSSSSSSTRRRHNRQTKVLERDDNEDENDLSSTTRYRMSDSEIQKFESTYNISYDPYYDEPYMEDELPVGKFKIDKSYGDRRYENGEIFYKEEGENVYYRQGSRPRQKKFWDWNSLQ